MDDDDWDEDWVDPYERYESEEEERYFNPPSYSEMYPLHAAVRRHDIEKVKEVLKREGAYLCDYESYFGSPLTIAATDDCPTSILQMLLDARPAQPSKRRGDLDYYEDESHALLMAAWSGSVEAVQILINAKAHLHLYAYNDNTMFEDDLTIPTPLFAAAAKGSCEKVKLLLEAKADVDFINNHCDCAADIAELGGHHEIVEMLLKSGAEPRDSWYQMRSACIEGRTDDVKSLLDAGYRLYQGMCGRYPLLLAAKHGHTDIVQMLVAAGAPLNVYDTNDMTPLDHMITSGNVDVAKQLIAAKADVNFRPKGVTALYNAAKCGNLDATKMLLDAKAQVDYIGSSSTALGCAAQHGHLDVMRVLIAAKASLDKNHSPPLIYAAKGGFEQAVRLLLDAKATPGCQDSGYHSPMYHAIENGHLHLLDLLFCPRVDSNPKLLTALLYATRSGNLDAMKRFIDLKAPLEKPNIEPYSSYWIRSYSPLVDAATMNNLAAVQLLLDARARIDLPGTTFTQDLLTRVVKASEEEDVNDVLKALLDANASLTARNWGSAVLLCAYNRDAHSIVKMFLEHNVSPNSEYRHRRKNPSDPNWTLLIDAGRRDDMEVAKILIEGKADVNFKPERADSPVMCAVKRRKLPLLRILIEGKASVDMKDWKDPLLHALDKWKDDDRRGRRMIKMLVKAQCSLGHKYRTALAYAVLLQKPKLVKLLSRLDPDSFDEQDKSGMTALMHAVGTRNYPKPSKPAMLRLLLNLAKKHCAAAGEVEPPAKRFKTAAE